MRIYLLWPERASTQFNGITENRFSRERRLKYKRTWPKRLFKIHWKMHGRYITSFSFERGTGRDNPRSLKTHKISPTSSVLYIILHSVTLCALRLHSMKLSLGEAGDQYYKYSQPSNNMTRPRPRRAFVKKANELG